MTTQPDTTCDPELYNHGVAIMMIESPREECQIRIISFRLIMRKAVMIKTPASAALGMYAARGAKRNKATNTHKPEKTLERRVFPPLL